MSRGERSPLEGDAPEEAPGTAERTPSEALLSLESMLVIWEQNDSVFDRIQKVDNSFTLKMLMGEVVLAVPLGNGRYARVGYVC